VTPASTASPSTPTPTATPAFPTGDLNQDGLVDIIDLQLCVNVVLGTEVTPAIVSRADLNADGAVNILDVQSLVNAILAA
jgi:hypothetical protein